MAVSTNEIVANNIVKSGTVSVSREINAPAAEIWQALTDPSIVSRWFGSLTSPLRSGQDTRLDFGDGDFFMLQDIVLRQPGFLHYSWRFLGIGPLDTITWRITQGANGCTVTVTDEEPGRTTDEASQLRKGWLDFTKRLKDFLTKGRPTRYAWRHDFEGSIELTGRLSDVWRILFDPAAQARWLPLEASVLAADGQFFVADGLEPSGLRISNLRWHPPADVSFDLTHNDWLQSTNCVVELTSHPQTTLLSVSHNNWINISNDKEYQKQQRKRFCEHWINILKRARGLVS